MQNQTYDRLKWGQLVVLPALGALYFGLGNIWGLPKVEEVVGTVNVLGVFYGALLGIKSVAYNKKQPSIATGNINVADDEEDGSLGFVFDVNDNLAELRDGQKVMFMVKRPDDPARA